MSTDFPINQLTVAEKLHLIERLWDDLAQRPNDVPSPAWHGEVLKERMEAVNEGRTKFEDWETVKKRLQEHSVKV